MIIRKPYAFLIKNFRRIHIFLLILSIYVAYKLLDVSAFVNDFMRYETYDLFQNPITNHITTLLSISVLLLVIGSTSLLFLLHHKKKPWKIYLVPLIEYLLLFLVLGMIKSFFNVYTTEVETTDLRMSRDLLMMFTFAQIPAIAIFIMRVFGLDIKKFNFNSDKEFLELSEEDREEIEIGLNVDKNSFIRLYRRFLRYLNYFYLEHKTICKTIIVIVISAFLFKTYQLVFVTNKSYKQGDNYFANGYTFKINNSYFTDKDYNGNIIEKNSNFVVIDLTIKNNSEPRKIYLENFHLKSGTDDYVTTRETFSKEFQDLGKSYSSVKELKRDEEFNCIIIYKVNKKNPKNRFVLYYQEGKGYLRKIKLKVNDISQIKKEKKLNIGESFKVIYKNKQDSISFDSIELTDTIQYSSRVCTTSGCYFEKKNFESDSTYKILKMEFSSEIMVSKNMIDFLKNYGKLIYKDNDGDDIDLEIEDPINKLYYGKIVYLKIPEDIQAEKNLRIEFIIRNNKYVYQIT